jgi:hypothetical protein
MWDTTALTQKLKRKPHYPPMATEQEAKRKTSHPLVLENGSLYSRKADLMLYAALSFHGSMTILVTCSFLSRHTSYIAGASSREIRCEMM